MVLARLGAHDTFLKVDTGSLHSQVPLAFVEGAGLARAVRPSQRASIRYPFRSTRIHGRIRLALRLGSGAASAKVAHGYLVVDQAVGTLALDFLHKFACRVDLSRRAPKIGMCLTPARSAARRGKVFASCAIGQGREGGAAEATALLDTGLTASAVPSAAAFARGMQLERRLFTINGAEVAGYELADGGAVRVAGQRWMVPALRALDHKRYPCLGKDFLRGHVLNFATQEATFRGRRGAAAVPFLYATKADGERRFARADGSLVAGPGAQAAPGGEGAAAGSPVEALSLEALRAMMGAAPKAGITLEEVERILFSA